MACFIAPATEALVVTIARKSLEKKEHAKEARVDLGGGIETAEKIPFSRKLKWLTNLLWGGSALLAFEHVWHGEVVPWFPFLTAASNPQDAVEMLREMATVGGGMVALVTGVWALMLLAARAIEKRAEKAAKEDLS